MQQTYMNICFYTFNEVSPMKGGTERITCSVATGLTRNYKVHCYSIYSTPLAPNFIPFDFKAKKLISGKGNQFTYEVEEFVRQHQIDILINQGSFEHAKEFARIMHTYPNRYSIFVHHYQPGFESHFVSLKEDIRNFSQFRNLHNLIRLIFYPIRKLKYSLQLPQKYHTAYKVSDRIVLLSDGFRDEYKALAKITEEKKFATIPNSLSFDTFFNPTFLKQKEQTVLIVSRLEEYQKKISVALKIWKIIEKDPLLDGWKLKIVGHGSDAVRYRHYVKRNSLCRITFEGAQIPNKYYENASLFMLTSCSEGWGLTLTEAQQYGCVPIAFDSYASLHDIICHNDNGCIIPNGDINRYADCLKQLMLQDDRRMTMAEQAIKSVHRFEIDTVAKQWNSLLNEIINPL